MSTVGKALALLNLVASLETDIGLTDLARLAGLDKATTRRFLVELEHYGFIEQDEASRKYRLGAAPVRLARIREARFPLLRTAIPFIKALSETTGETCHLAEFSHGELRSLHVEASSRANRVNVEVGITLPLHATASGLALLACLEPAKVKTLIKQPLEAFTRETVTDILVLEKNLIETRSRGWSINNNGLEAGVISAAAAIIGPEGQPVATLAVAAPEARIDELALRKLGKSVAETAERLSAALFGTDGTMKVSRKQ